MTDAYWAPLGGIGGRELLAVGLVGLGGREGGKGGGMFSVADRGGRGGAASNCVGLEGSASGVSLS